MGLIIVRHKVKDFGVWKKRSMRTLLRGEPLVLPTRASSDQRTI